MSVENHPHSGCPSTSRTDENVEKIWEKSTRTVGTQLTRSQKLQVWVGVPVSGFWPWIWTLFPACSHRTKKTLVCLCARSWKIRLKVTQTFFLRLSRMTKFGAMGMTLRPNKFQANGRRPLHLDRKKQDKWGQMWQQCSLFFSMSEESFTGNLFLLDRLSIRNFTWRFWGNWERMCEENAQNCGDQVNGFSIRTMPQLTQLCLWPGIWPLWDGPSFPTHPIHRT